MLNIDSIKNKVYGSSVNNYILFICNVFYIFSPVFIYNEPQSRFNLNAILVITAVCVIYCSGYIYYLKEGPPIKE